LLHADDLIRAVEILRSSMLGMAAAVAVLGLTSLGGVIAIAVMFARYLDADRRAREPALDIQRENLRVWNRFLRHLDKEKDSTP